MKRGVSPVDLGEEHSKQREGKHSKHPEAGGCLACAWPG